MEETLVVIDEKRRRALLGEWRETDIFAPLPAQLHRLADHVGKTQPRFDLVEEAVVEAHRPMIAPRDRRVAGRNRGWSAGQPHPWSQAATSPMLTSWANRG